MDRSGRQAVGEGDRGGRCHRARAGGLRWGRRRRRVEQRIRERLWELDHGGRRRAQRFGVRRSVRGTAARASRSRACSPSISSRVIAGIDVAGATVGGRAYDDGLGRSDVGRRPGRHHRVDARQPARRAHQHPLPRPARVAARERRQHLPVDRARRHPRVLARDPERSSVRNVLVPLARARALGVAGVRRLVGDDHRAGPHRAATGRPPRHRGHRDRAQGRASRR